MAPMSNAERQKKYRENLKANNPDKYEEKRKTHLEKVKKNKKKNSELSETEQKKIRDKWRQYSAKHYNKKKDETNITTSIEDQKFKKMQKKWRQKALKMHEKILELTSTLQRQIKSNRCLRKQIIRLKNKVETMPENSKQESTTQCCLLVDICNHTAKAEVDDLSIPISEQLTPMKKTEMFLDNLRSVDEADKAKLKEKILELNVLSDSLKQSYESATKCEKQTLKTIVKNPITQRYKIVTKISKTTIGLTGRIRKSGKIIARKRAARIKEIHDFYNRDDVTRCTAGKKETKTKNKNKVQRKYLLDSVKELYKKYKDNGGKASYTSLLRHRPFYVLNPKLDNCDTCACIKHANFTFKILKLHKVGYIKTSNINEIMTEISCNINSKPCMYGECSVCSTKTNKIQADFDSVATVKVAWLQWCLKKVEYQKRDKDGNVENFETKKFKKEIVESSLQELISKFQEEAIIFKKHFFNINHQQKIFKESKEKIQDDEAVLLCDFSENYNCKYNTEIQGMHFGSSRNQITLHTGVVYVKNQKPISFCTLSPSNEHNPFSIWAHLLPVINTLKYHYPKINKIHFFSDGPSTQYRQKIIFYLFSKLTKELGYDHCTWNYFESAHGKNAADGIGGAIKRNLDKHVAYGSDIPDAVTAFEIVKKTSKISLYLVTESDIEAIKELLANNNIKPLKGTMSVHQIVTTEDESHIKYRDVSCLCGENIRGCCACFNIKDHILTNSIKAADPIIETELVKENRKVTVLSDITFSEQNTAFIGYENMPLCLKKINPKTDLLSRQSTSQNHKNVYGCLSSIEDQGVERFEISRDIVNTKKSAIQSKRRKRCSNICTTIGNNKKAKKRKRSSSMTTTSESGEISVHSDSDLLDALSDLENDYDETNLNEKIEMSNKTIDRHNNFPQAYEWNIEKPDESYQKQNETTVSDKTEQKVHINMGYVRAGNTDEEQQIINVKKGRVMQIDVTEEELQIKSIEREEMMEVHGTEQKIEIDDTKKYDKSRNICKPDGDSNNNDKRNIEGKKIMDDDWIDQVIETKNNREYKELQSVDKPEDFRTNDDEKKKELESINKMESDLKEIDETEKEIYHVGDTVLVRYFKGKSWRYYVGVIKNISDIDRLYTISFYKTVGARDKLKFRKPFRQDIDTVPETLVVKIINMLQISVKPKEHVLMCDDDLVYFK